MRKLTIYRLLFTASDCYNAAKVQTQRGVQVHCTTKGASYLRRWVGPDDGRLGKNQYSNYHNRPGGDVCASAYIGKLADKTVACYQALPWDYRCWLSGSYDNGNANKLGYIGFEIASDNWDDEAYFRKAVMGVSVNLTAYLCTRMGVSPRAVLESYKEGDALAVMDHSELRKVKLASNHSDISKWLKVYGLTMDDYRDAVEAAMAEGVEVTYIDSDTGLAETVAGKQETLYEAKVTCPGAYLNLRAAKSQGSASLMRLDRGVTVSVLDDSDPDWWRVQYAGVTGYAMSRSGADVYLVRAEELPIPDHRETLRQGSKGEDVRELQRILRSLGYALEIDGMFGTITDQCVKSFQGTAGLVRDGIVTPQTWAALDAAATDTPRYTVTITGLTETAAAAIIAEHGGTMTAEGGEAA